jgi:hypothetical protein
VVAQLILKSHQEAFDIKLLCWYALLPTTTEIEQSAIRLA